MTISIETTRVQYVGNGTDTVFAYPFKILEDADLLVLVTNDATLGELPLTLNADYTVSGAGVTGGGNVILSAGSLCGSGYTLTILRNMAVIQGTDYVDGEAFSAESIENALDKVTMIQQQQREEMIRTLKLPRTSPITDITLPNPAANNYIGWNASATALANLPASVITTALQYEIDALVSYGGGTSFTQATIEAALTAIGTQNKVTLLFRPGTWPIISNADWSAYTNVTFKIVPGAVISHGAFTVKIPSVDCGLYQIFDTGDTGLVTFGSNMVGIYPDWYGGTDTQKVQAAVNSCLAYGSSVGTTPLLVNRQYILTSSINIDRLVNTTVDQFRIISEGYLAGFYTASAISMFSTTIASTNYPVVEKINFENIRFEANLGATDCYVLNGDKFLRMQFMNCIFRKIRCAVSATYLQSFHFSNCDMRRVAGIFLEVKTGGLVLGLVSDFAWTDNTFEEGGANAAFLKTIGVVSGANFSGGVYENAAGSFYSANKSFGVAFTGMYFEVIADYVLKLSGSASGFSGSVSINGNFFNGVGTGVGDYAVYVGQLANVSSSGNYTDQNLYYTVGMANGGDGLVSKGDYAAAGNIYDWGKNNRFLLTAKLTGFAADKDITLRITKNGNIITCGIETAVSDTSTTTSMTITGIPAALLPVSGSVSISAPTNDNSIQVFGRAVVTNSGIRFYSTYGTGAYTASGAKGVNTQTLVWYLPNTDY